jgi:hypothetical protein
MMALGRRLLILSCSQRKRPDPGLLPAIERYDGPAFRVLRKFFRERPLEMQSLDVYILSAEFGLFSAHQPIPNYDRRMTPERADDLRRQALTTLEGILKKAQYEKLFISVGKDYLQALAGYELLTPADLKTTLFTGTQGRKLATLRDWLYGSPHTLPYKPVLMPEQDKVRIRGVEIALTSEQVLEVARQALAERRGDPTRYQAWYALVADRRVAPKWLVSQLTGLPLKAFVTSEALRILKQLGIEVVRA